MIFMMFFCFLSVGKHYLKKTDYLSQLLKIKIINIIKLLFMKRGIVFILFIIFSLQLLTAQATQVKNNPVGTWKFSAPYAPEGYTSGTIVVGFAEQKHTTTMSFTGNEYKLPGENVKAVEDSVLFSVFLEGQDIKVLLKMDSDTNMTGKAVYSEGEVPLALSRVLMPEQK